MNVINDRIYFDFHGIASMAVDANAPTAALLHDIFFPFVTARQIKNPDLVVTGAPKPVADPSFGETEYDYTETSLYLHDSEVQILKHGEQYEVNGTRELLVSALPIIDRILVTKGVGMVHAATIEYKGQAINLPAWGGTGKTSTIAKLLRRDGYAFMGDDWAFLANDGRTARVRQADVHQAAPPADLPAPFHWRPQAACAGSVLATARQADHARASHDHEVPAPGQGYAQIFA